MTQQECRRTRVALLALVAGALAFSLSVPGPRPVSSPAPGEHLVATWSSPRPAAVLPASAFRQLAGAVARVERWVGAGHGMALIGELLGLIAAALAFAASGRPTSAIAVVGVRGAATAPRAPPHVAAHRAR